jgi:hypothetical protein
LEDDEHTGQPRIVRTELKIQEVAMLVRTKHSQMADEIIAAAAAGIYHGTCHQILSDDLNMSFVTQHNVPSVLMQDQCDNHMRNCGDMIDSADKDGTFPNRIITGCFLYDLYLKRLLATWKSPTSPRKKKT